MMNKTILIFLLFTVGCHDMGYPEVRYIYKASQTRPDGQVTNQWIIRSDERLSVSTTDGGQSYIDPFFERTLTPTGWYLELKYAGAEDLGPKKVIYNDRRW